MQDFSGKTPAQLVREGMRSARDQSAMRRILAILHPPSVPVSINSKYDNRLENRKDYKSKNRVSFAIDASKSSHSDSPQSVSVSQVEFNENASEMPHHYESPSNSETSEIGSEDSENEEPSNSWSGFLQSWWTASKDSQHESSEDEDNQIDNENEGSFGWAYNEDESEERKDSTSDQSSPDKSDHTTNNTKQVSIR